MFLNIYCFSILIIFLCIVFIGFKKENNVLCREQFLQTLHNLRGIFALEVVLGHIAQYDSNFLCWLGKFMICSVAFFFFISAFGMVVSFEKKEKYLSGRFIVFKPLYLFTVAAIIYIVEILIDISIPYDIYFPGRFFQTFLYATNWYIWELIIFYLLFFISYKFFYKFRIAVIIIVTAILSVTLYRFGAQEMWYASAIGFPLGIIFAEFYDVMKKILLSWKGVLFTLCIGIFGLSSVFIPKRTIVSMLLMRNGICLAAIFILFYVCSTVKIGNNQISKVLCKYATEIYLSQFIWIEIAKKAQLEFIPKVPFVLLTTGITVWIIHFPIKFLQKWKKNIG